MLRPNCLVRVHKNDSFPWFHFKCEAGDKLATIWQLFVGKRKGREVTRLFFTFFSQEKKFGTDQIRSSIATAWWKRAQHFDHYTKRSSYKWRFRRYIYTREPNSSFSPARWQRDWPLSLDNTFETDSTSQIRSYLEVDFLHDANTSIEMEVK